MNKTIEEYTKELHNCRTLFEKKLNDYGTSWRIMRTPSITDQIFIKAQRIRTIQQAGEQKVADNVEGEFIGIVNYAIIGLIQLELTENEPLELNKSFAMELYHKKANEAMKLMKAKNHDYGEAWRDMRVSSLTDLILMKIYRTKQIEDNNGMTIVSEGIDANYFDMINYSIFALIKLNNYQS